MKSVLLILLLCFAVMTPPSIAGESSDDNQTDIPSGWHRFWQGIRDDWIKIGRGAKQSGTEVGQSFKKEMQELPDSIRKGVEEAREDFQHGSGSPNEPRTDH